MVIPEVRSGCMVKTQSEVRVMVIQYSEVRDVVALESEFRVMITPEVRSVF